jgi:hypothetical protein
VALFPSRGCLGHFVGAVMDDGGTGRGVAQSSDHCALQISTLFPRRMR